MELKLELPQARDGEAYLDLMREWLAFGGRLNPAALQNNGADYETWLRWMCLDRAPGTCPPGAKPQTLYFLRRRGESRILGALTIRGPLDWAADDGVKPDENGNIGYGIRPSERGKGYGRRLLALGAEKCRALGFHTILVTCDADNAPSKRVIAANGGVLIDGITGSGGNEIFRYRITL